MGQGQGLLTPLLGLVTIAQLHPELRDPGEGCDPWMISTVEGGAEGLPWVAEAQALLQMCTGHDKIATIECRNPQGRIALQQQDRVVPVSRHVEEFSAQLFC